MEIICTRCLRQAARRSLRLDSLTTTTTPAARLRNPRPFSQTTRKPQATPITAQTSTATSPRPGDRPAATSTPSVSQPFSTPLTPAPSKQDHPAPAAKHHARVHSSVPAGTVLKGLNFIKGKADPVALEDDEYPAWLWGVLDKKAEGAGGGLGAEAEGDLFSKSKKQRRKAAKSLRKQQLLHPESMVPKVPLYEQSIDLPSGDGTLRGALDAGQAREELTEAMREKRRKKIKEDNFLRAMA